MKADTIRRILEYYPFDSRFEEEVLRAYKLFFGKSVRSIDEMKFRTDIEESMFYEWFVFDFKLSNGRTPLEDFYLRNPYNLNREQLQIYKDLQDNHFGFYKVKKVNIGEGLLMENLHTGKIYSVKEFLGTFEFKKGQVFPARVGWVNDHYEMVGTSPPISPIRFNKEMEISFRKLKQNWNPMIIWKKFFRNKADLTKPDTYPTIEEAQKKLKHILAKYGLNKFVDTERIKEWIYHQRGSEPSALYILFSLLNPDNIDNFGEALNEIAESFSAFYNLCPQKALGDKNPIEKDKEYKEKGRGRDVKISQKRFPVLDWVPEYDKAMDYLKQKDFKNALRKLNGILRFMLKQKITYPEIYRLYANKGICHFAVGEPEAGIYFLTIAREINPFYDFARKQLKRLGGSFNESKMEDIKKDIGYKYYQFLKPLKINFAQKNT